VTRTNEVLNPALPDDDFDAAARTAQAEFDEHHPDVVVGQRQIQGAVPHHEDMPPGSNRALAEGRDNRIMVNTPRTVPKGIKMHSIAAATKQYI
jgi:hypothetical protein